MTANSTKKPSNRGLGRGLGALLGELDATENEQGVSVENAGDRVESVLLTDIDPNREQPRRDFDPESLRELADSIASVGVIQPIVLTKNGDRYTIIAGERRWRASRLAGLTRIPAIIRDWNELTRIKAALIENLQRDDLNPVEEALGIRVLIQKCGITQEAASKVLGKSRSAIANSLRLLTLDNEVLEMLKNDKISAGHARALVSLEPERQRKLAELVVRQGLSVRQLERICAQAAKPEVKPTPIRRSAELNQLEKMARDVFGIRAKLDGDENTGKLVLNYSNHDDLERIWEVLDIISQSGQ